MLIAKKIEDMSLTELNELSLNVESRKKALTEKEVRRNPMPEQLKKRFIEQVAQLIKGRHVQINVEGIAVKVHIFWEEGTVGKIRGEGLSIPEKSSSLTRFLFETVQDYCSEELWQDDIEPALYDSKEYDDFNRKIAEVCSLSDEYERVYDDYSWDDILNEIPGIMNLT